MERRSASEGERRSAQWVARRLREAGAEDVRVQPYRYSRTFAWAYAAYFAAALVHPLLAAAACISYELDFTGRSQWLRRFLPKGEGANVLARVPASGPARRTLVLVAHHDAAHTGLMWHPLLSRRSERLPFSLPAMVAMALRSRPGLALGIGLMLDQARSATVPGANDNATGVAALLALVERYAREPLEGTEVVAVTPGSEESGLGGMRAWLDGVSLDRDSTLVICLDTLGSGEPVVASAEGGLWPVRYDTSLVPAGVRRYRVGGWTDAALARLAGLRTISLLSVKGNGFPNYHLPSDTPEKVDFSCVDACLELADTVVREWVPKTGV